MNKSNSPKAAQVLTYLGRLTVLKAQPMKTMFSVPLLNNFVTVRTKGLGVIGYLEKRKGKWKSDEALTHNLQLTTPIECVDLISAKAKVARAALQ